MSKSEKPICPTAFSTMELGRNEFIPCCHEWLTEEYHNLDVGDNPWNGPQAQALRQSILMGDYKYCDKNRCTRKLFPRKSLEENPSIESDSVVSLNNLAAIKRDQTILPEGPTSLYVYADPRCNLACGSCRSSHIFELTVQQKRLIEKSEHLLNQYRESLQTIRLAADGEVFFSPWLRRVLKNCTTERYPNLRYVHIQSNGLLFDEKAMEDLKPGTDMIREVQISVDAGDEATYKIVRGGDWHRLIKNLEWIATLRAQGRIGYFQINFVVRKANFRSIPDFVKLGRRLGVDIFDFCDFRNWGRAKFSDFDDELVTLHRHPNFEEYCDIIQSVRGPGIRLSRGIDPEVLLTSLPLIKIESYGR